MNRGDKLDDLSARVVRLERLLERREKFGRRVIGWTGWAVSLILGAAEMLRYLGILK